MKRRVAIVLAAFALTACNPILPLPPPPSGGAGCDTALVVRETNTARGNALAENAALDVAAQNHSVKMAGGAGLTHDGWDTEIRAAGYTGGSIAQNIAYGYSATEVVDGWMASAGHRANILNPAYRDIGVGCVNKNGTLWWTQDFGG